jgi:alkylhydroperoxidase/carboxymuconolactone decarboxylase family protein YurZ
MRDYNELSLPGAASGVARDKPEVWNAFEQLGAAVTDAGPLDDRSRRLVHLALAIGGDSEGATHSHCRRALEESFTPDELEHVAYLAITTLGWPRAIRALTWIRDVTNGHQEQ